MTTFLIWIGGVLIGIGIGILIERKGAKGDREAGLPPKE